MKAEAPDGPALNQAIRLGIRGDQVMTLAGVREEHPRWTIGRHGRRLLCIHGPWRFLARDPAAADEGIRWREKPWQAPETSCRTGPGQLAR